MIKRTEIKSLYIILLIVISSNCFSNYDKQYERSRAFWEVRKSEYKPSNNTFEKINNYLYSANKSTNWEELGPKKFDSDKVISHLAAGRINCIEFHPVDVNTFYVGSASGSLWRTLDNAKTWEMVDLGKYVLGISDIIIDWKENKRVYVSSGDSESNFYGAYSTGIFYSEDDGLTWEVSEFSFDFADSLKIRKFIQSKMNDSIFYIATNIGVYRSLDKCRNFEKVSELSKYSDIVEDGDGNIFSAYQNDDGVIISKSADGGIIWEDIYNFDDGGRVSFSYSEALDNELIILVGNRVDNSFLGLYKLNIDDYGIEEIDIHSPIETQSHYNNSVVISPFDRDIIYFGGQDLFGTIDGGASWEDWRQSIHVDHHHLEFHELTNQIYSCNDGGVYRKSILDKYWENITDGLDITQFYSISLASEKQGYVFAGSQDNNGYIYNNREWNQFRKGDLTDVELIKGDRNKYIAAFPHNRFSNNVLFGLNLGEQLREEVDAKSFFNTRFELSYDNDELEKLFLYSDNLYSYSFTEQKWEEEISFNGDDSQITGLLIRDFGYYISKGGNLYKNDSLIKKFDVAISDLVAYKGNGMLISFSSYDMDNKVLIYDGEKYVNISYDLPNVPVNKIFFIDKMDRMFVGTDIGVFELDGSEKAWRYMKNDEYGAGIITDIKYNEYDKYLYVSTFGKGIWRVELLNCGIAKPLLNYDGLVEICEGDSVTVFVENLDKIDENNLIWNDGITWGNRIIGSEGEYYLRNNGAVCNEESETIVVKFKENDIELDLSYFDEPKICEGEKFEIRGNLSNNNYSKLRWSNGDSGRTIFAGEGGYYYAYYEDLNGCVLKSDSLYLKIDSIPERPVIKRVSNNLIVENYDKTNWYYENELIDSNKKTLKIDKVGNYWAESLGENGCRNKELISIELLFNNTVPFEIKIDYIDNSLRLKLLNEEEKSFWLKIYDMNARLVLGQNLDSYSDKYIELEYNLSNFSDGVYLMKFQLNDRVYTRKLNILK